MRLRFKRKGRNLNIDSRSIAVPKVRSNSPSERLGLVSFHDAGIAVYSPLGITYLNLLSRFIMDRLTSLGFREFRLPILQNQELWKLSGRYHAYTERLESKNFVLSATAEEYASWYAAELFKSKVFKEAKFVQHEWKFRNELRSKGLLRTREFYMSDGYSFHLDQESLYTTLAGVVGTYSDIFRALKLRTMIILSDGSAMGDGLSLEFVVPSIMGETRFIYAPGKEDGFAFDGREYDQDGDVRFFKGIEVGHVFALGQIYPRLFDISFQDNPYHSGSYGIGISRLMEVLCCKHNGLDWSVFPDKPFDFILVSNGSGENLKDLDTLSKDLGFTYWTIDTGGHVNQNFSFARRYFIGCNLLFQTNRWWVYAPYMGSERRYEELDELIRNEILSTDTA